MSVVNKMLQDLETRKKQSAVSADYVPKAKPSRKPVKPVLLAVAAVAFLVLGQQIWTNQSSAPEQISALQVPASALIDSKADIQNTQAEVLMNDRENVSKNDSKNIVNNSSSLAEHSPTDSPSIAKEVKAQSSDVISTSAQQDVTEANATVVRFDEVNAPAQLAIEQEVVAEPAQFSVAPSSGDKGRISLLREQARIALADNNIAGASNALETLLEEHPEDLRARKQLASLLFSHNSVEQAQRVLSEGLAINPADNAMRIMLARVAYKTGDYQDAHRALSEHPYPELADTELLSFRAALAERLSQYVDANHDYKLLVAREPQNAKWWLGLGVSQDKLKRPQQAIASYQQAKGLKQLPSQVDEFVEQRIAVLERQS